MIRSELLASVADDDHESDLGGAESEETADEVDKSDLGNAESGEIGKELRGFANTKAIGMNGNWKTKLMWLTSSSFLFTFYYLL